MNIGIRVMWIRSSFEMTQRDFASALMITQGALSNIERGNEKPSKRLIRQIGLEFNVNEEWLHCGIGEMFVVSTTRSPEQLIESLKRTVDATRLMLELNATMINQFEQIETISKQLITELQGEL